MMTALHPSRICSAFFRLGLFLALALAIAACDSGGDETESLEGVWKSRGDDVYYLVIGSDRLDIYDFLGDDFDEGDACYLVFPFPYVHVEGNEYIVDDVDLIGEEFARVTLARSGEVLTLSFSDASSGTTLTQQLDRSALAAADLKPSCDDVAEKAPVSQQKHAPLFSHP